MFLIVLQGKALKLVCWLGDHDLSACSLLLCNHRSILRVDLQGRDSQGVRSFCSGAEQALPRDLPFSFVESHSSGGSMADEVERKPPCPPFTRESALAKVKAAEAAWNTRDPEVVAMAYTKESEWRNRTEFFKGREAIKEFLRKKWEQEQEYRLMKELWAFTENHIAVRFEYEWRNEAGQWFRTHGNELWEFEENGLMRRRDMSANDVPIQHSERRYLLSDAQSDEEELDADVEASVLGLQSHWDSTYADELVNFHEQGDNGEIWFGEKVMDIMASWTARVCIAVAAGLPCNNDDGFSMGTRGLVDVSAGGSMALELANWNVLDLGTGNGLLLHALAKQGFTNLTGTDYSQAGVELARAISARSNTDNITFLVDDVLDTKINQRFKLVTDKGTLDAIGLHPDGPARRIQYWKSVCKLIAPGGILAITSCNSTKDELVAEVNRFTQFQKSNGCNGKHDKEAKLEYIDHVRTYPTFRYGGVEGSRVSTVAFVFRD